MIVMHMSGAYENQSFFDESATVIDCRDIQGTNCYCDDVAKEQLRERIEKETGEGLHFLDSGNYHYLSLLWMEKIKQPFSVVLFDHHPDMQPPSFGEITSCGGWIKELLETNSMVQKVYMVGVAEELASQMPRMEQVEWNLDNIEKEQYPIYISFDKDVLSPQDAKCDWDQGDMELVQAKMLLQQLFREKQVIAMDVCGEDSTWQQKSNQQEILDINNKTNLELKEMWEQKK